MPCREANEGLRCVENRLIILATNKTFRLTVLNVEAVSLRRITNPLLIDKNQSNAQLPLTLCILVESS